MEDIILSPDQRVKREVELDSLPKPIDFALLYGNANPVELEIGMGKGLFLMKTALENPDRNFFGLEIARKYLNVAVKRIEKRPIHNIRLVRAEALSFLKEWVSNESLAVVHLYFPDPWPKTRHNKRRLFNQAFLTEVHRVLVPGGHLLIATDHADYWAWMQEHLAAQQLLKRSDRLPEPASEAEGLTSYEIKYQREGRAIYRVGYQKP